MFVVMFFVMFCFAEAYAHRPHNERRCGWIYPEWCTRHGGRAVKVLGVAGLPEHHGLRGLARCLNSDDSSREDIDHAAIRVHDLPMAARARHDLVASRCLRGGGNHLLIPLAAIDRNFGRN
jgi:hypothetical protein